MHHSYLIRAKVFLLSILGHFFIDLKLIGCAHYSVRNLFFRMLSNELHYCAFWKPSYLYVFTTRIFWNLLTVLCPIFQHPNVVRLKSPRDFFFQIDVTKNFNKLNYLNVYFRFIDFLGYSIIWLIKASIVCRVEAGSIAAAARFLPSLEEALRIVALAVSSTWNNNSKSIPRANNYLPFQTN